MYLWTNSLMLCSLLLLLLLGVATTVRAADDEPACNSDLGTEGLKSLLAAKMPQVRDKVSCGALSDQDCMFFHEAGAICPCTCGDRLTNGNANRAASNNNANSKSGGGQNGGGCFHNDGLVQTEQYGEVSMADLALKYRDARVLTRNDQGLAEYSPIVYWLHAQTERTMEYLHLQTSSGHRLWLTGNHLIYKTDCNGQSGWAVLAADLRLGDCLLVNEQNDQQGQGRFVESRLVAMDKREKQGLFAPVTATGSIVVDDVLASCYANYENESAVKLVYAILDKVRQFVTAVMPEFVQRATFNVQSDLSVALPPLYHNILSLSQYFVS